MMNTRLFNTVFKLNKKETWLYFRAVVFMPPCLSQSSMTF